MTAAIETRLRERLADLTRRIQAIEGELGQPMDDDSAEQAIEREDDQALDAVERSLRQEAEAVRQSLARLRSGDYGVCMSCGLPIAAERLAALPTATRCIACAASEG